MHPLSQDPRHWDTLGNAFLSVGLVLTEAPPLTLTEAPPLTLTEAPPLTLTPPTLVAMPQPPAHYTSRHTTGAPHIAPPRSYCRGP